MITSLCLLLPLVQGPVQGTREPVETPPAPNFLTVEFAGFDALLTDPKDQALAQTLALAGTRLEDLPKEIQRLPLPPTLVPLVVRTFGGPFRASVGFAPGGDPSNPVGFAVDVDLHKSSADEAAAIARELTQFLGGFGIAFEEPAANGLARAQAPVPAWMGASGEDVVVRLGNGNGVEFVSSAQLLPSGTRFALGEKVSLGALVPLLPMVMQGAAPEEQAMVQGVIESFGLDQISVDFAMGTNERETLMIERVSGIATLIEKLGILAETPLDSGFVKAIPKDAIFARLFALNVVEPYDRLVAFLEGRQPEAVEDLRRFEAEIGLNVRDDLLAPLSGRFAMYSSNTTGGGILSTVMIVELTDPATMNQTLSSFEAMFNAEMGRETDEYLQFVTSEDRGIRYDTLRTPGLPFPLELTFTISDRYLIVGASPQSVRAAVEQALSGADSLLDAPGFRAGLGGASLDGSYSVGWFDTPELLTAGYGTAGLLTAALSNMMRSPREPGRAPTFILPSFHDLERGVSPMVALTTYKDGVSDTVTRADRSQLVNLTGMAGSIYRTPFGLWVLLNAGAQSFDERDLEEVFDF